MMDCPHLERMGYGGDGNSSTMTLQTMYDVRDTYHNWQTAWKDAMGSNGSLPYVAPAFPTGGGPYWSGFIIKAAWRTYLNYRDPTLFGRSQFYDMMKRWLNYVKRYSPDGLLQPWPDEGRMWFLGDWLALDGVEVGGESALFVSNCFIVDCLGDMERMAKILGHGDDVKMFAGWRKRLKTNIHQNFYHPETHTYANGTPLDQSYALLMDIAPNRSIRGAVEERLLSDCHGKYNDHIAVGLMGVPIFTEWCIRERQADLMATILRQPDYPGYLHMLNHGATTTWESWGCERDNGEKVVEDRSRVHNCYNGVGIWFYQALAGIRPDPDDPGYQHFFIDPQPVNDIDWVRATKPTLYGTIRVEINGNWLKLEVPEGTTATVFPGTSLERTVGEGVWEFPF
jgi:alpha-L-rhamnosidase